MQENKNEPKIIKLSVDTTREDWLDNDILTPWIASEALSVIYNKLQHYMLLEDKSELRLYIQDLLLLTGDPRYFKEFYKEDQELVYVAIHSGNPKALEQLMISGFESAWLYEPCIHGLSYFHSSNYHRYYNSILASRSLAMLAWMHENNPSIFFKELSWDWLQNLALIAWDEGCIWFFRHYPWLLDYSMNMDLIMENLSIETLDFLSDCNPDFLETRDHRYLHFGHYAALLSLEKLQWLARKAPKLLTDSRNPCRMHPMHFAAVSTNPAMRDFLFQHNGKTLPPSDAFGAGVSEYALINLKIFRQDLFLLTDSKRNLSIKPSKDEKSFSPCPKEQWLNDPCLNALMSSEDLSFVYDRLKDYMKLESSSWITSISNNCATPQELLLLTGNMHYFREYSQDINRTKPNSPLYMAIHSGNPKALEYLCSEDARTYLDEEFWGPAKPGFSNITSRIQNAILASRSIAMLEWINEKKTHIFFSNSSIEWFLKAVDLGWDEGSIWFYEHFPWMLNCKNNMNLLVQNLKIETLEYFLNCNANFLEKRDEHYLHFGHYAALYSLEKLQWLARKAPNLLTDARNPYHLSPMHFAAISGKPDPLYLLFLQNGNQLAPAEVYRASIADYALCSGNPEQFNQVMSLSATPWTTEVKSRYDFDIEHIDIPGRTSESLLQYFTTFEKSLEQNICLISAGYRYMEIGKLSPITTRIHEKLMKNAALQKSCLYLQSIITLIKLATGDDKSAFSQIYPDLFFLVLNKLFKLLIPDYENHAFNPGFFSMLNNRNYLLFQNDSDKHGYNKYHRQRELTPIYF